MKKGRLKEIVKELQKASKMHLKQSEEIAEHRKLNKPFYSEEHKVNVDIEDGVLSNTPKSGNYPKA